MSNGIRTARSTYWIVARAGRWSPRPRGGSGSAADDSDRPPQVCGLRPGAGASQGATLQRVDEKLLRSKIEQALRREGLIIDQAGDVRDGSQASLDLLFMVMETRGRKEQPPGFVASACLQHRR